MEVYGLLRVSFNNILALDMHQVNATDFLTRLGSEGQVTPLHVPNRAQMWATALRGEGAFDVKVELKHKRRVTMGSARAPKW